MIERLEVLNYRGVSRGALYGLGSLTVLVGPNNSGKSTVLEALLLAGARGDGYALSFVGTRRGWTGLGTLQAWIRGGESRISSGDSVNMTRLLLRLSAPDTVTATLDSTIAGNATFREDGRGGFSTGNLIPAFIEPQSIGLDPALLDRAVSQADLAGERRQLIDLLKPLLPGLRDLRILQAGSRYALHVEDDSAQPWPAAVAGDGLKKLLVLASSLAADQSGLVLVEEPETYLHVGAYSKVAQLFWQAANAAKPKQIVATTHSLEFVDALFGFAGVDPSKATLFRLSLAKGELKSVRVPGDKVRELREEIGEDLRR